ncbi:hypothetical protein [Arthrobacter mobilis]|uniref:Uncharacterized protein n=1 Tax=Arthrobacter mobilis TaxID=2724944 RepID=A0A7X6K767_9MICC|nr:hypothetical protein [Arthrobacter mobilis]NKX56391.1 hypothetical protein [Arthrobacter mobilis]
MEKAREPDSGTAPAEDRGPGTPGSAGDPAGRSNQDLRARGRRRRDAEQKLAQRQPVPEEESGQDTGGDGR